MFRRYNEPLNALNLAIRSGELETFLELFANKKIEDELFNVWLHKCFDERNFIDFKNEALINTENKEASEEEKVNIVNNSFDILADFTPPKE